MFKNIRFYGKIKKLFSAINKYIETFDTNTITSFYFTNRHF